MPDKNSPEFADRNQMVVQYTPLVNRVVGKMMRRLPPSVDPSDLFSAGSIGLIDAVQKFDPDRCSNFRAYAEIRIRGAILDELREQDWVPRSLRRKAHSYQAATRELQIKLGRAPQDHEIAEEAGVSLDEYRKTIEQLRAASMLSFDDLGGGETEERQAFMLDVCEGGEPESFSRTYRADLRKILAEAVDRLKERERLVVSLYYFEELNLKEIGQVLGVSESRVSQLHSRAMKQLRRKVSHLVGDER